MTNRNSHKYREQMVAREERGMVMRKLSEIMPNKCSYCYNQYDKMMKVLFQGLECTEMLF